ncbi:hypothetical protein AN214_03893 [Pseudoalteromonas sp. P1-9]|nr:hypothetical protein AN214_03893 [Pseudoalteromonas sp. P1-9]
MNFLKVAYSVRLDNSLALLFAIQFSLALLSIFCSYCFFEYANVGIGEGLFYCLSAFLLLFGLGMLVMLFLDIAHECELPSD